MSDEEEPQMTSQTLEDVYKNLRLDTAAREIRLLRIVAPPDESSVVQCFLEKASLDEVDLVFDALSYTWNDPYDRGEPPAYKQILLNGVPTEVTYNLEAALRHIEQHQRGLMRGDVVVKRFYKVEHKTSVEDQHACPPIWIDALCINQSNIEERSHQVNHMSCTLKCC